MTQTPGLEGIKVLQRDNWAEGIPLTKDYVINSRFKNISAGSRNFRIMVPRR